jgi:putative SOS response-associated peptidase YedK
MVQPLFHDPQPRDNPAAIQDSDNRAAAYEPQNAIFPGYQAPVVRKAADGERELAVLNWGMLLQKDRAPRRVTNVRDDKILESKFWRPSFEQRRCLVPASSYCEPKGEKPATWHWFSVNGDDARPPFAFPGCGHVTRARQERAARRSTSKPSRS